MVSRALAFDPIYSNAPVVKALTLQRQGRLDEASAEDERALALNPALSAAYVNMGFVYRQLGRFEESLQFFDKTIRQSPNDPDLPASYANKAGTHVALKQYNQAIESARRAIAISPNYGVPYWYLITALALTGQESQAREALQRYLTLRGVAATVPAVKQERAKYVNEHTDPRYVEYWDRLIDGLRKAGMPEE